MKKISMKTKERNKRDEEKNEQEKRKTVKKGIW